MNKAKLDFELYKLLLSYFKDVRLCDITLCSEYNLLFISDSNGERILSNKKLNLKAYPILEYINNQNEIKKRNNIFQFFKSRM